MWEESIRTDSESQAEELQSDKLKINGIKKINGHIPYTLICY